MPDIVMILWLPAAIAFMAVTWVLTLSAVGPRADDSARRSDEV
jgi:hypothetical protein